MTQAPPRWNTGAEEAKIRIPIPSRAAVAPVFLIALGVSYLTSGAERIPRVEPLVTEEGQAVVFDRITWQLRELAKKLPVEQAWPQGQELERALDRFGLASNAPPKAIPVPAQIAPDVYLVGQDRVSNLTYMVDCGPEGVAVIDPTYESEAERTMANVEKCGRSRKEIKWVLNTHCHVDHAMADSRFREAGAEIMVHAEDADAVEKGTRVTAYFLIEGVSSFPRCKVDRRLSDGEELRLGNKLIHVIHTPGHTPGSVSFCIEAGGRKLLFSGDTVLYDYRLGWQGNPYADNRRYLASLQKLESFTFDSTPLRWDLLLPGHGAISMDKAYLDVSKARELVADDLDGGREILSVPFSTRHYRERMYGRPPVALPR
ncbi:MAG: MBL fold metallo-hydrolase [Bryobacteraceae bacterium]|nr:MBL fold metallo-hydrolase [Bryobacteraceae bacterium]